MFNTRIIPRLDIKGPNLVKGIHLEGLRVLGKPEEFAHYYYENGADELIFIDTVASLYGRNSLLEIIERTAQEIFIPLTVGGGLRSEKDIFNALNAGADKVAINSAAIRDPQLIHRASRAFGSSTIVLSIEAKRQPDGRYLAYTHNGREKTSMEVLGWAQKGVELGAGEILLTSIDRDGTGMGYDLELTGGVARSVDVPVIASGGAGRIEHIRDAVLDGMADAVAIASIIHYGFINKQSFIKKPSEEGNIEFLKTMGHYSRVEATELQTIKRNLTNQGISCRYEESYI
jgi:cyclase